MPRPARHFPDTPLFRATQFNPVPREDFPSDKTPDMVSTIALLERFSRASSIPILLVGEFGTGKSYYAHRAHRLSPRQDKAYAQLTLTTPTSANDFLAYLAGGLLKKCDGGTLCIENVEHLSLDAQNLLFKFMREKRIKAQGSREQFTYADVRIIVCTTNNLAALVEKGKFSSQLFMALRPAPLMLPNLRDRPRDMPHLAQHFLDKATEENGLPALRLSAPAVKTLRETTFPNNLADLRDIMARAALMAAGDTVKPIDIGLPHVKFPSPITYLMPPIKDKNGIRTFPELWDIESEVRRRIIAAALIANNFNTRNTARALGMKSDGALAGNVRVLFNTPDFKRTTIEPVMREWPFKANDPFQDIIETLVTKCKTLPDVDARVAIEAEALIKHGLGEANFIKSRACAKIKISPHSLDHMMERFNLGQWFTTEHRNFMVGLLESCHYNPTHAAARTGTDVRYITATMREYGITAPAVPSGPNPPA